MRPFFLTKTSSFRYVLILSGIMGGASAAAAESLTLQQSVAMALKQNRLLAADQYRVDMARAGMDEANGYLLPRVDASYSAMRSNSPMTVFGSKLLQKRVTNADFVPATLNHPAAINNYQPKLTLSMPLYQGGALWAGRRQAEQGGAATGSQHEWMRQQLMFQTIQTYMAWLNASAQLQAAEKTLEASGRYLNNVVSMHKRGLLIESDVMDAEVHRLQSEVRVNQSRNAVAESRDMLARLTGVDAEQLTEPVAAPEFQQPQLSGEALTAAAMESRPDLKALQAQLEASRAGVDKARSSFLPHVAVQATQEWNNANPSVRNGNATVSAVVSMNIFAGGSDRAVVSRQEADAARLSLELDDKRQQIGNEVRDALRQLTEAQKRSKTEARAMKQAEESLRITELRHLQGLEKTSDLLNAQSRADMARAEAIRAGYDVSVAKAQLMLFAGRLGEESLMASAAANQPDENVNDKGNVQ